MTSYRAAGSYYFSYGLRAVAHGVKDGDPDQIKAAAHILLPAFPESSVLIPMPSHDGNAESTLALVEAISAINGMTVLDVLKGRPRMSQYDAKYNGVTLNAEDLGLYLDGDIPEGLHPCIVDNVIATGLTARAAINCVPHATVFAIAYDETAIPFSSDMVSYFPYDISPLTPPDGPDW